MDRLPVRDTLSHRSQPATQKMSRVAGHFVAICLAPIAICINFTNYGPLIPLLQHILHVTSGQIGLFSAVLFLCLALANIPGGILSDIFGARRTMLGSLFLVSLSAFLCPLIPTFSWMIVCRALTGLGAGIALVAGSHATAQLGRYEALAQGLNGGAAQLGAGLGLVATPSLLALIGWQSTFVASGLLGLLAIFAWLFVPKVIDERGRDSHQQADLAAGVRSRVIWTLGLSNMGTFGLGNAVTAWLAVYFAVSYGLSLPLAAGLGSLALFAGALFRPLGGIILARSQRAIFLIRGGTLMAFLGLIILALPIGTLPIACGGLLMFSLGTTLPYAAIFSTAAHHGKQQAFGSGVAQGLIAVLASPVAIVGPPIIGLIKEQTGMFTYAFGFIVLVFSVLPVIASWYLSHALALEERKGASIQRC
ncbi:putative nitrate transporter NarT [Dictyobacter aurantiacus]|uniref:Putative nitrate transporter NarT n=2 Tax=Dictyobacter aurantiacus TaxID=1936993 RepID=A0A401ZSS0_9CHLR|nr:putative nitrate transporter NarT [Dictyobacter aurantiacus]